MQESAGSAHQRMRMERESARYRADARMERSLASYRADAMGSYASGGSRTVFETCEQVLGGVSSPTNRIQSARSHFANTQGNFEEQVESVISELYESVAPSDQLRVFQEKARDDIFQKAQRAADDREDAYIDGLYRKTLLEKLHQDVSMIESSLTTSVEIRENDLCRQARDKELALTRYELARLEEVQPSSGSTICQAHPPEVPSPPPPPSESFEEALARIQRQVTDLRYAELRKSHGVDFEDSRRKFQGAPIFENTGYRAPKDTGAHQRSTPMVMASLTPPYLSWYDELSLP